MIVLLQKQMKVVPLILEEAPLISEWAHNFRPEYLILWECKKEFLIPQMFLLTAILTKQVRDGTCGKIKIDTEHVTVTGF